MKMRGAVFLTAVVLLLQFFSLDFAQFRMFENSNKVVVALVYVLKCVKKKRAKVVVGRQSVNIVLYQQHLFLFTSCLFSHYFL